MLDIAKMDFINLTKSILSLFETSNDCHYNFAQLIGIKLRNSRPAALDIYEQGLRHSTGERSEFPKWISLELRKFFAEFASHFATGNETSIRLRLELHRRINKECKQQKF